MALGLLVLLPSGCGPRSVPNGAVLGGAGRPRGPVTNRPDGAPFQLVEVAAQRGIEFRHAYGSRSPLTIVETMGGGAAFFDYDGDGWQDVFLVSSGQDFKLPKQTPGSKLYRNIGMGRFEEVTAASGIVIDGYATGCCTGDYDNDGDEDLFVGGYEQCWLFRNRAGAPGHLFEEVSGPAGLVDGPDQWGIGCAFVDVDRDGWLDLYVANYVRYDPKIPFCITANVVHGCTPNQYTTQPNMLYMNLRNGRFAERARALGAQDHEGAGLGVVVSDFDLDGWQDIFIANDGTPNALLHNRHGRFENVGQASGVAYGEDGTMRAGMGTDAGDLDGDGLPEVAITNFSNEPTSVYRNRGRMNFTEISYPSGVGTPTLGRLKFGLSFLDLDGDGLLDIYEGNGHVHDNVEEFNDIDTFEQVDQIFHNLGGGRFREILPETGGFPGVRSVTRATAVGDFNNDGAPDLLINSLGRPVRLLENQPRPGHRWLGLKLMGTSGNRSAIGARVELRTAKGLQLREVRSGGSYIGQSDLRVLFGLGNEADLASIDLSIRWPGGRRQVVRPEGVDQYLTVKEVK